jgi:hypothetical protein
MKPELFAVLLALATACTPQDSREIDSFGDAGIEEVEEIDEGLDVGSVYAAIPNCLVRLGPAYEEAAPFIGRGCYTIGKITGEVPDENGELRPAVCRVDISEATTLTRDYRDLTDPADVQSCFGASGMRNPSLRAPSPESKRPLPIFNERDRSHVIQIGKNCWFYAGSLAETTREESAPYNFHDRLRNSQGVIFGIDTIWPVVGTPAINECYVDKNGGLRDG